MEWTWVWETEIDLQKTPCCKEKLVIHPPQIQHGTWKWWVSNNRNLRNSKGPPFSGSNVCFLRGCKLKNQSWVLEKELLWSSTPAVFQVQAASFREGTHNHHPTPPEKLMNDHGKKKREWRCILYSWWWFSSQSCWFSEGQIISQAPCFRREDRSWPPWASANKWTNKLFSPNHGEKWCFLPW